MDEEHHQPSEPGSERLEGIWYASSFRVGQNAFEFKVDCGHEIPGNEVSTVYLRVIANPFNARELFKLLGAGLLRYGDLFGAIDDNGNPEAKSGVDS